MLFIKKFSSSLLLLNMWNMPPNCCAPGDVKEIDLSVYDADRTNLWAPKNSLNQTLTH